MSVRDTATLPTEVQLDAWGELNGIGIAALRFVRCLMGRVAVRAPWVPGIENITMELAWRVEHIERAERDRVWAREWDLEVQQ